jgi:hypothetical protein
VSLDGIIEFEEHRKLKNSSDVSIQMCPYMTWKTTSEYIFLNTVTDIAIYSLSKRSEQLYECSNIFSAICNVKQYRTDNQIH